MHVSSVGNFGPFPTALLPCFIYTATLSLRSPTMDVNFRKIDVDQYDEDVLLDSELYEADPRDPAQALDDTKQKATAVRSSLSKCVLTPYHTSQNCLTSSMIRGDIVGALTLVLTDAPYGPNAEEAKVRTDPAPNVTTAYIDPLPHLLEFKPANPRHYLE